jgi:BirA family biotin operon repressor/biotin-[acetyl-CoA-carboxylase] ligase
MDIKGEIIWLDTVDSTNRYAKDRFGDLSDGALVLARMQTAGKGRLGRTWVSPEETNIYASFVMKNVNNPFYASMVAALGALEAIRALAPEVKAWLKWPNDIYCRECKIAGILCETITGTGNAVEGVIAGVGINLNMTVEALAAIDQPATSLFCETGEKFNLKNFAKKLALMLIKYYITYSISSQELFSCWKKENLLIGKRIEVLTGQGAVCGIVADLGSDGEILLDSDGQMLKLYSGDVRISKDSIDFSSFQI